MITDAHKPIVSTQGHALAVTGPLQAARVVDAESRLKVCRTAILQCCQMRFMRNLLAMFFRLI